MKTAFAVFAEQVELVDCGDELDALWSHDLLSSDVRGLLNLRPYPACAVGMPDALRSTVDVAREWVYGRTARLWEAQREIAASSRRDDATTLLLLARNVLLAADAVASIEWFYDAAERRAVVAAGIAEIRGDAAGVAAARDAVAQAAADALCALDDGAVPVAGAIGPGPLDLIRAEIVARLRGEAGGTQASRGQEVAVAAAAVGGPPLRWGAQFWPAMLPV
jgi:hypothetical protein